MCIMRKVAKYKIHYYGDYYKCSDLSGLVIGIKVASVQSLGERGLGQLRWALQWTL